MWENPATYEDRYLVYLVCLVCLVKQDQLNKPYQPNEPVVLVSHTIPLRMAAVFGLFKFVDELLQFVEFVWSDVLKRDSEFLSSHPLHTCVFD